MSDFATDYEAEAGYEADYGAEADDWGESGFSPADPYDDPYDDPLVRELAELREELGPLREHMAAEQQAARLEEAADVADELLTEAGVAEEQLDVAIGIADEYIFPTLAFAVDADPQWQRAYAEAQQLGPEATEAWLAEARRALAKEALAQSAQYMNAGDVEAEREAHYRGGGSVYDHMNARGFFGGNRPTPTPIRGGDWSPGESVYDRMFGLANH